MNIQKIKLSCIVLSCDSHNKGGSVFHCLCSIFNQNFDDFEVILVENSHKKTLNIQQLENKLEEWNSKRKKKIKIRIINNKKSLTPSKARNIGASRAEGEVLVFIDDDTIIINKNSFSEIFRLSESFDYGYGAVRLWTKEGWFKRNSFSTLSHLENGDTKILLAGSGVPPKFIREKRYPILQRRTFIANFGFCKKDIFDRLSGFANLPYYRYEDDYLMFRLYESKYRLALLSNLKVVHVSHPIDSDQRTNLIPYFVELVKRGYYWFNINKIFSGEKYRRDDVLEKLGTLHFDYRIESLYKEYINKPPLDLEDSWNKGKLSSWRKNNLISRIDMARLVYHLQNSKDLDSFVKKSNADFDNLAQIVDLATKQDIIKVTNSGRIRKSFDFHFTQIDDSGSKKNERKFIPDNGLNQFPCDDTSRLNRKLLLKLRYPFAEYLKFAIIGDDDFLSLEFLNDYWFWPVVIEKDERIVNAIIKHFPRAEVIKKDVATFLKANNLPSVQSFITDPPYTLYGSLAFIYAGLKMLNKNSEIKEFYVILNPTMMGKNIFHIQKILSESGVFLTETVNDFSQYKLPKNFKERSRANKFLNNNGIRSNSLEYSSSSVLYIFKTISPDLQLLAENINFHKLYEHYL